MSTESSSWRLDSEEALAAAAAETARRWRTEGLAPLIVALAGDLGSGKTTWVRAMLRGLGHTGRVPSPTYTLVEHYPLDGLTLVHLDLYRLAGDDELEMLGLRDWLDRRDVWLLVEWAERAPSLAAIADIELKFEIVGRASRRIGISARSDAGHAAVGTLAELNSRYGC